jgi:Lipocalin-like domain
MSTKTVLLTAILLSLFTAINAPNAQSQATASSQSGSKDRTAIFNGAWRTSDNKGFSVMHDGYFNSIAQDSTGKWDAVHAGTYKVNKDNTITFKVLYSSYPDHVGAENTAEYTLTGQILKVRHFKKLIDAQGKDITDQMPKDAWETSTRLQ